MQRKTIYFDIVKRLVRSIEADVSVLPHLLRIHSNHIEYSVRDVKYDQGNKLHASQNVEIRVEAPVQSLLYAALRKSKINIERDSHLRTYTEVQVERRIRKGADQAAADKRRHAQRDETQTHEQRLSRLRCSEVRVLKTRHEREQFRSTHAYILEQQVIDRQA